MLEKNDDGVTPETPAHGHHHQLGVDESTADGGGDFFGAFHAETNMAIVVADENEGLKGEVN
jgi:hypothetical protein